MAPQFFSPCNVSTKTKLALTFIYFYYTPFVKALQIFRQNLATIRGITRKQSGKVTDQEILYTAVIIVFEDLDKIMFSLKYCTYNIFVITS